MIFPTIDRSLLRELETGPCGGHDESRRTLDTQALVATAKKVRDYCRRNPETAVMQAVETVLGTAR
jgi:hypothetical protein